MAVKSYCVYCGEIKLRPLDKCDVCSRVPRTKKDIVGSLLLSTDTSLQDYTILTENKADEYASKIKKGEKPGFSDQEIKLAEQRYVEMNAVSSKDLILYFIKFGWPIIIPVSVLIYALLE